MSKSLVLSLVLLSSQAIAAQSARVLMIRGQVTTLLPGKHNAISVQKGDLLPERTSVLTKQRSVVRLRFSDGTTVNLGPMSKIIISDLPKVKANVISLLTGTLDASVNKRGNDKNKLFVKTKNSVMGVRGTKFKSGFNHVNSNTSLLTIEGNVAISKVEDVNKSALINDSKSLNQNVRDLDFIEVKAGKFSNIKPKISKPSVPVKIDPKQFNAIAKQAGSKITALESMRTPKAEDEVKAHLAKNSANQSAYLPGGYVDFRTGQYVEPEENAKLNLQTGTYTATKKVGIINVYGGYKAPKGIKLDAKKGFILASNSKSTDKETLENLQRLNKVEKISSWGPRKHILSVRYEPVLSSYRNDDNYHKSKDSSNILFGYEQVWNDKWESGIFIGDKKWRLDKPSSRIRDNDGSDGKSMSILELRYNLSPIFKIGFSLISENFPVIQEGDFFEEYFVNLEEFDGISPHVTYAINNNHALNARYKYFSKRDIRLVNFNNTPDQYVDVSVQTLRLASLNSAKLTNNLEFVYDISYELLAAQIDDYNDLNMDILSLAIGLKWSL